MTINRRDFFVRASSAVAAGTIFGDQLMEQASAQVPADTLYVSANAGADSEPGTKDRPIKTLTEAATRINGSKGKGGTTIILAEGVYLLDRTALFKTERQYTKTERLTIRAESLPDAPAWAPARMPVLLPVMQLSKTWMGRPDPFGGVAYGIQVETSHVTIQGFKILGTPHYELPAKGQIHRVYPYLALNLVFFLLLLPIHLEIRYSLFMLGGLLTISAGSLFLINPKVRKPLADDLLVLGLGVLVCLSAWSSYQINRRQISLGPREVVQVADWMKANIPAENRGKVIAARKPHIAYYADLEYLPLPMAHSPEEMIRQLKEMNADYLYVGRAEIGMRPELRALIDPRGSWPGLKRIAGSDNPISVLYHLE